MNKSKKSFLCLFLAVIALIFAYVPFAFVNPHIKREVDVGYYFFLEPPKSKYKTDNTVIIWSRIGMELIIASSIAGIIYIVKFK